jgi:hypothetical protein
VWAVPGKFFQSLPVPCGASPNVISPDVIDSKEKKIKGSLICWGASPDVTSPRCNWLQRKKKSGAF